MNPPSTIPAWLAPLVGLQGFPYLVKGERKKGWTRFGIGLGLILGPIAWDAMDVTFTIQRR